MKATTRWLLAFGLAAGVTAAPLHAQTQAAPDTSNAPAKAAPHKAPPKKKAAKMPASKKDDRKKAAPKKAAPKKGDAKADPRRPVLKPIHAMEPIHDDKGNAIPITPDAYDVSSAVPGKPAPKPKKK